MMKVLLIDDHHLIREALQSVLKELDRKASIFEATTGAQAVSTIAEHPDINLVLLDLALPDRDGFSLLRELRQSHPAMSVVVLSATQDRSTVVNALDLGASGFIPKTAPRDLVMGALQLVMAGGVYIPPQALKRGSDLESPSLAPDHWCAELGLSSRQIEVLTLMMAGKSNKTICRELDLAEPTVKTHVTSILRALNVHNRTEAVVAAQKFRSNVLTGTKP